MAHFLYPSLLEAKTKNKKKFVVLIDPDGLKTDNIDQIITIANSAKVDYFFVGGSLIVDDSMDFCIKTIRQACDVPIILFPGSPTQIHNGADAILFLSLISGRNPELLIGKHVEAAPILAKTQLEVLPTGYMLIDSGRQTTASYMSNTFPIPANKNEIAVCTALAGQLLGLKLIFMDAGSGAKNPVREEMIAAVNQHISIPLIVGGGIKTPEKAYRNVKAGADVIVVGNAIEKDPSVLIELADAVHSVSPVVR